MANIGSPVQGTDFALDALGRYVCNTYDEALANSDPMYRAAAQLSPRGDMRPFDFIIIGGGTFGTAVAEHLWFRATGRSERILVLEAGPFLLSGHTQNFPSLNLGDERYGECRGSMIRLLDIFQVRGLLIVSAAAHCSGADGRRDCSTARLPADGRPSVLGELQCQDAAKRR